MGKKLILKTSQSLVVFTFPTYKRKWFEETAIVTTDSWKMSFFKRGEQ